ncbi:hypothetical protein B0J12DRAFT_714683 [Macrophomina phaseolina]|uniref:DUF7492 domain-containing protein n=1 Tax=Macrophomina phaseolina TaxID=35725 RepID=A0ABQ8FRJ6_9PEZI|nr:hypothetical protein B0J12DRAFT_714683 [Macrophomina phaseolina]
MVYKWVAGALPCLCMLFGLQVAAHSWIDQLAVISQSSSIFIGHYGYPRGYVARSDAGFTAAKNTHLLPAADSARSRINASDMLCLDRQRVPNQPANWPRLKAAPGDWVALRYAENGHVTLPWNTPGKPELGGTTYIYGTHSPVADEKILDVLQWNTNGTSGDGRGRLLASSNFDDGRCHQINDGNISLQRQRSYPDFAPNDTRVKNELYCESDVKIPEDALLGSTYTLYWIWEWPTVESEASKGKDEWYTTCMDVDIQTVTTSPTG